MLNEILFDDKKDLEIARLKSTIAHLESTIQRFKAYDEERKQYYAKKIERLNELENIMLETSEQGSVKELKRTVNQLKMQLAYMSRAMQVRGIEEKRSTEELKDIIEFDNMKKQYKELKGLVKRLHAANDELFLKIMRLEKELKSNNATVNKQ